MSANPPGQLRGRIRQNGPTTLGRRVDLSETRLRSKTRMSVFSNPGACCWLLFILIPFTTAQAAFIGPYSLASFTLTNSDSVGGLSGTDGFAMTPDAGLSIVLTGGNSGSGLGGTTGLIIQALASGLVQFHYSYSTLDSPGNDLAGYLLGNNFFQLSSADGDCNGGSCPGVAQFAVTVGQSFGFRVDTLDNQGEPGILTISDFSATSDSVGVPEPSTGPAILVLLALASAARLFKRQPNKQGNP